MDRAHWGLSRTPFRTAADGRFFYHSPTSEEALARLMFLVEERRRLGLLLGGAGGGKTTLLAEFAAEVRRSGKAVALVNATGACVAEVLWELVVKLGVDPSGETEPFPLWRKLWDRIVENRYQQIATVLLFDDLDQATADVQTALLRLYNFAPTDDTPLTLVASAKSSGLRRIDGRLLDAADLRVDLSAWTEQDTAEYVQTALRTAGANPEAFAEAALARLHELSGGVPRHINQLADLSLIAGAGQALHQIDPATVESVYDELSLGSAASAN